MGSVSLIVGGIGIMNIVLVFVAERRAEISIRRALGARRRDIQSQFLIEAVIPTVTGGMLGMAATWTTCRFAGRDFPISSLSVASGLGTAAAAGASSSASSPPARPRGSTPWPGSGASRRRQERPAPKRWTCTLGNYFQNALERSHG